MTLKNKFTAICIVATAFLNAQEIVKDKDSLVKPEVKISFLDSIKKTFVNDEMASCVDSLWAKEMVSLDSYDQMITDIKNVNVDQKVDYELPTELLKERLKKLDEKSPFNIEYNEGLENVIKSFLKNRKKTFERLMGISQFYFPIFEEELAKNNIPLEIKYLAVVESALNPKAVSRVGATGLWQFMYQTGKQYGLNISSYVDERSDPLKASSAASEYMKNMFKIFGDWDLVLASYNSGPGNVSKAIRRSGGYQNYWNIRKHLPKETQGYLPAFLATMYIFEYHKEHGIVPNKAIANHFATDTIMVKRHMSFKQISDLLDISVDELKFYNPSYKRQEVPYISGEQNFIRLPKSKVAVFTSNEDKIYAYVDYEEKNREKPFAIAKTTSNKSIDTLEKPETDKEFVTRYKFHKVKRGENIYDVALKYGVTANNIRDWNNLKGSKVSRGKTLKIVTTERIAYKQNKKEKPETTDIASVENPTSKVAKTYKLEKVTTNKQVTKYHKVKRGDNLSEIASKYDVDVSEIKKWNKIKGNNLIAGKSLKIVKTEQVTKTIKKEVLVPSIDNNDEQPIANVDKKSKKSTKNDTVSENYYIVAKGENLFSIAKKHHVTVEDLKEWNNLFNTDVKAGTQLVISGESTTKKEQEIANKSDFKEIEYTVAQGDNLSSIAKKHNTTIDKLKELNNLDDNVIKLGQTLVVSKEPVSKTKTKKDKYLADNNKPTIYQVRKGDTLLSISKKFPGVTIADIKKWNKIKNEKIKPGMKLKINS